MFNILLHFLALFLAGDWAETFCIFIYCHHYALFLSLSLGGAFDRKKDDDFPYGHFSLTGFDNAAYSFKCFYFILYVS